MERSELDEIKKRRETHHWSCLDIPKLIEALEAKFEKDGLVGELVDELRNSESCLRELSKAIKGGVLDSQSVLLGTNKRAWNLAKEYAESAKAVLARAKGVGG